MEINKNEYNKVIFDLLLYVPPRLSQKCTCVVVYSTELLLILLLTGGVISGKAYVGYVSMF